MNITKEKTHKGISYALKSSWLKEELLQAEITTHIDLLFLRNNHIFFEAFYWLPNKYVDYDRFYVRTGVVKYEIRQQAQSKMKQEVIPQFIDWAKQIVSIPHNGIKLFNNLYFCYKFKAE